MLNDFQERKSPQQNTRKAHLAPGGRCTFIRRRAFYHRPLRSYLAGAIVPPKWKRRRTPNRGSRDESSLQITPARLCRDPNPRHHPSPSHPPRRRRNMRASSLKAAMRPRHSRNIPLYGHSSRWRVERGAGERKHFRSNVRRSNCGPGSILFIWDGHGLRPTC